MGDVVKSMKRALRNGKVWTLVLAATTIWSGCAAASPESVSLSSEPVPPAAAPAALPATISRLAVDGGCARNPDRARGRQRSGVDDLSRRGRGAGHRVAQYAAARRRARRESAGRPGVVGRRCGRRDQRPTPHPAHRPDPAGGRAHARRRTEQSAHRHDAGRRRDALRLPAVPVAEEAEIARGREAAPTAPSPSLPAPQRKPRSPVAAAESGQLRGAGHARSAPAGAAADRPAGLAPGECRGPRRGSADGRPGRWRWRVRLLDLPVVEPRSLRHRPRRRGEPERAQQRAPRRRDPRPHSRLTVQAESRGRLAGGLRSAPDRSADHRTRSRGPHRPLRRLGARSRSAHDGSAIEAPGPAATRPRARDDGSSPPLCPKSGRSRRRSRRRARSPRRAPAAPAVDRRDRRRDPGRERRGGLCRQRAGRAGQPPGRPRPRPPLPPPSPRKRGR